MVAGQAGGGERRGALAGVRFLATGQWRDAPGSNLLDGAAPFYRCYACADGRHVAVGALEPQFFAQLITGLGLSADRFEQNDPAGWPAMEAAFTEIFASRARGAWEVQFAGTDACVTPVLSMAEAADHPANRARRLFVAYDGVDQAAPAPRLSVTPGAITPSTVLGVADAMARWSS